MRFLLLLVGLLFLNSCVRSDSIHLRSIREENATADQAFLDKPMPEIKKTLTLLEIIDLATYNNLDLFVKQREWAIQHEKATGEKLKTLPSYTFSGEHSWRNKSTASFSVDATTGQVSTSVDPITGAPLPPGSIGSEQRVNRYDLTAAYNLVDFGVSYFRARQERHREASTSFQFERQRQNIVLNVFKAYWKGLAAKYGIDQAREIIENSRTYQDKIDKQVKGRNIPRIQGLRSELQLVNMRLRFGQYEGKYREAKAELAALMGLPPYFEFDLADVDLNTAIVELEELDQLGKLALTNRPELYATDAEERIFDEEAKAAMIQMFPSLSIFLGRNFDADRFLIHHYWTLSGARVAWNLLALPQRWYDHKVAYGRKQMTKDSRLALTVGVLTQLHIAAITYKDSLKKYENIQEIVKINKGMLASAITERQYGEFDDIDLINFRADSLESEVNALQAYGETQIALELVNNSIGIPLYYKNLPHPTTEEVITKREGEDDTTS